MNPTEIREENIPEELRKIPHWICWAPYMANGKLDKIPVAPWLTDGELKTTQEGRPIGCSYTDPKTHVSFLEALSYARKLNIGIGFVLVPELNLVAIDLDDCIEDGKPNPWVERILAEAGSYAEITPSGKGVRIWLKGSIPRNIRNDDLKVEIYKEKRFLTVTGWWIESTPREIRENQKFLDRFYSELIGEKKEIRKEFIEKEAEKSGESSEISCIDILKALKPEALAKLEKGAGDNYLQGEHPVHGSEHTGRNFAISEDGSSWYCFRHNVGGRWLSLSAMLLNIVDCEELARREAQNTTFITDEEKRVIIEKLKSYGLLSENRATKGIQIKKEGEVRQVTQVRDLENENCNFRNRDASLLSLVQHPSPFENYPCFELLLKKEPTDALRFLLLANKTRDPTDVVSEAIHHYNISIDGATLISIIQWAKNSNAGFCSFAQSLGACVDACPLKSGFSALLAYTEEVLDLSKEGKLLVKIKGNLFEIDKAKLWKIKRNKDGSLAFEPNERLIAEIYARVFSIFPDSVHVSLLESIVLNWLKNAKSFEEPLSEEYVVLRNALEVLINLRLHPFEKVKEDTTLISHPLVGFLENDSMVVLNRTLKEKLEDLGIDSSYRKLRVLLRHILRGVETRKIKKKFYTFWIFDLGKTREFVKFFFGIDWDPNEILKESEEISDKLEQIITDKLENQAPEQNDSPLDFSLGGDAQ